ncbi:hypothetical protein WOLCODRAFT_162466 [Wolfiporia cocos MD-104 SS10]|uniref:Uncharacterized protein n=1 Tax=Wolfiporia cocos (strain MD-104) TaxID=742152 RepID=A0A2H3JWZ4_WOLCO|nr:hypothetical protein WOLCODRAFT_162466 [Wolfiporia cocos MD-104 SS10]
MRASTTFLAVAAAAAALVPVHASVPEQTRPWSSRYGRIGTVELPRSFHIGTTEIHDGDGFAIHPARELAGLSLFQEYLKEHPGAFSQGKRELAHIHPIIGTTVLDARETALPSAIPSLLTWASSLSNDPVCKSNPNLCMVGKRAVPESDIFGKFHPIIDTTVLNAREPEPAVPAQLENWIKTHPLLNGKRAPEPAFNFEQYLKEHPFFKYAMDKREPFNFEQYLKEHPFPKFAIDKREPFNTEWLKHLVMDKRESTFHLSPELLKQLLRAGRMDRREATSDIYGKFHPIIGTTVLPGEKF